MCQKQIEDLILDLTGRLELSTEEIKQLQEAEHVLQKLKNKCGSKSLLVGQKTV